MASWTNIYLHDVAPEVSSQDGRIWITLIVDGAPSSPNTVTMMLKSRDVAHKLGEALIVAAREPRREGPRAR